jgi:two-component system chemotaxis response regulator CheB
VSRPLRQAAAPERIRVLIVDHSPFVRRFLADALARDPAIDVVGAAADAEFAWRKIEALQPDVLTLDIAMPHADGLSFLEQLMRERPLPVVMLSALTVPGGAVTRRALALGACDFVTKPRCDLRARLAVVTPDLCEKIKAAARTGATWPTRPQVTPAIRSSERNLVIAVGVSTGGPVALETLLRSVPVHTPGMVIVQHMPGRYLHGLVKRLNDKSALTVRLAAAGERVLPGTALIAPGDRHLEIVGDGTWLVRLVNGPAVNHHRPSVDRLFQSVAAHAGPAALGILLTGMGSDGADGLLAMKTAGAWTIAQDEASSVVFGMPKEAIRRGAADRVVPLDRIGREITAWHARRRPPLAEACDGEDPRR